ncbi:hypothetical protein H6P81_009199 [Aristolochia fimbriata]|uniref:Photosystem II 10 kDa polypeptide, chloroplastic n=1 Tax=Aristolochia fimbriata TaxID=158543 RepID=A0AAV7EKI6_ARIFI|nr:hypothetical protein H6P81_009199 [Aristolochia fimbriata]
MAASVMSSLSLKPSPGKRSSSEEACFHSQGLLLSRLRPVVGKGVYQFVDKYGANVDGYSVPKFSQTSGWDG